MIIRTSMVDFPSNGQTTPAFLAHPDDGATHPAIVVIQEWWGLVPHIKDVVERFAREDFIALAPDLYHGQIASEPDEARKIAMALDRERAVQEIGAAASYLAGLDGVAPRKVGVVGWCMGGGLALSAAAANGSLGVAVCFYGRPLAREDVARLRVPVLGLYAEHDHGITPDAVRSFESDLRAQGIEHQIHIYPGTQHAFFNDTRPGIYHQEAATDAWTKTLAWFRAHLPGD